MNDAPENFEQLQKLLALKRHEQPPPGYFNRLPGQIIARLEGENAARQNSFLEKLFAGTFFRPAVAYGFLGVFCALAATGVVLTFTSQNETPMAQPDSLQPFQLGAAPGRELANSSVVAPSLSLTPASLNGASSTNAIENPDSPNSLFEGLRLRQSVPVSSPSGNR
ncbi:MAG: hypothetical protein H7X97_06015 [Opitutaceae bacterium]|nr:hypothetical protein [Verrucomicrobiales bacterium]